MHILATLILFLIFSADVVGGSLGGWSFLGDLGELLVLLMVSVSFSALILNEELKSGGRGGKDDDR